MSKSGWGLGVEYKEMLDKLFKFVEESQLTRVLEINFVTKTAWVLDDTNEREIRLEFENDVTEEEIEEEYQQWLLNHIDSYCGWEEIT